jgi:hypothetical protein
LVIKKGSGEELQAVKKNVNAKKEISKFFMANLN